MKLRLVAIEAACKKERAAGERAPSDNLRTLANTAGLQSETLDALRLEAKLKLDAALADAMA